VIALALLLAATSADPLAGTWEGTSLCQMKPSPCHDEHVVYRIKSMGGRRYHVDAYKIVAGQELFMGPLELSLDASAHLLAGSNRDRSRVGHPWLFTISGNHMSGKALSAPGGQVFRLIEVTKR
jgi:hypothetical protein